MDRAFTNILTDDVEATARFYQDLLGMMRTGDFGWFVILSHPNLPGMELGILDQDHETVPLDVNVTAGGTILTFVVADVEAVFAKAKGMGATIIDGPSDLPYGQRRLLLRDRAGTVVDASAPIR
ncbi:MAG: VOC family protein [Pseudomonadota bacterium]